MLGLTILQHCYERLWRDSDPLVVLGHALGETDNHIAAALAQHPGRPIAYGVYPGSFNEVSLTIAKASAALTDCNVLFFDSTTHPITAPSMNSQGGQ